MCGVIIAIILFESVSVHVIDDIGLYDYKTKIMIHSVLRIR